MPEIIIKARKATISEGMEVKRILPFRKRRMVGPFIFMDHAGPINIAPNLGSNLDVLPHPHIGLSTVTYLFGGQVMHRDGLGTEQIILPGEVNWMTAGKGISHSERFEDPTILADGKLEMIQTWVALPEKYEEASPEFTNYKREEMPVVTDKGIWMQLIAGEAYGIKSPVKTYSPLFYLHAKLEENATLTLPDKYSERGIYVAKGTIEINGHSHKSGEMIVFYPEEDPIIKAKENTDIMILGGEPLGKRFIWWNFVSSSRERIEQAKHDWESGKIILPPTDNEVFIPLPEQKGKYKKGEDDAAPEPNPLS